MKFKYFVVEGAGSFPTDMLRYDHCWPASSEDATAMDAEGRRRVVMMTYEAKDHLAPTGPRWQSFVWPVKDIFFDFSKRAELTGSGRTRSYVEAGKGEFSGEYRVRWKGHLLSPSFNSEGAARAYLDAIAAGTRKPEYPQPTTG